MTEPNVKKVWLDKLARYEGGLTGLIKEIYQYIPAIGRDEVKLALAKLDLAIAAIEDMLRATELGEEERAMRGVQSAADHIILLRAEMERRRTDLLRDEQDLERRFELDKKRRVRRDLDSALGLNDGGPVAGHGLGGEE